jgi:hypothetical protein
MENDASFNGRARHGDGVALILLLLDRSPSGDDLSASRHPISCRPSPSQPAKIPKTTVGVRNRDTNHKHVLSFKYHLKKYSSCRRRALCLPARVLCCPTCISIHTKHRNNATLAQNGIKIYYIYMSPYYFWAYALSSITVVVLKI